MEGLEEQPTIAIGDLLDGKYQITGILGSGAMGVVYEALHTHLQRIVALKTLRAELAGNTSLVERFAREARAASAIGHPNIVQVFDAGDDASGLSYLALERLRGQSLGDLLRESGPLDVPRTIEICCQLLEGLGAAHSVGILHRDIKPDNIFIAKEEGGAEVVKILDFGISKFLDVSEDGAEDGAEDGSITQRGTILGTPNYMSPEQICASPDLDMRADLWSVGCLLYKCLCRRTPFVGKTRQELMAATLQGNYVSLRERCPQVPEALDAIVSKLLMPERKDRYENADSLLRALRALDAQPQEPKMLAAFDNLAERFLEQEGDDGNALPDEPKAPADRFAPPGSDEEVELELGGDPPRGHQQAATPVEPVSLKMAQQGRQKKSQEAELELGVKRAPRSRARRPIVTREEPSTAGAWILKSGLLILVVAAAGAGYRQWTLGYVLSPGSSAPASISLDVVPKDAQVFVNGELMSERTFSLDVGKAHHIRVAAGSRIEMATTIDAQAGESYSLKSYLSQPMPAIREDLVAVPMEASGKVPKVASVDAARNKLDTLGDCGLRFSKALQELPGKKAEVTEMPLLDRGLLDECKASLGIASGMTPEMPALDEATRAFRDSVAAYNQSVAAYQKGKGASRRELAGLGRNVRQALRAARKSDSDFRSASSLALSEWLALELLRIDEEGGDGMHSQVRNLAVSSDTWMRSFLAGGKHDDLRRTTKKYFAFLEGSSQTREADYRASGITAYLNAIRPLIESEPGEHSLAVHNHSVEVFNKLRLPIPVEIQRNQD